MRAGVLATFAALPLPAMGATPTNAPAPELSLSFSGVVDDAIEQGEPLRVAVRLESSEERAGAVELAPSSGTWVDAIAVELCAVGKSAVVLRASAIGAPESPRATLDRGRVAGGSWIFPAKAMQELPLGDYVVRARLSIQGGAGWTGGAISEEMPLSIVAVSSAAGRVSARTLVRAQLAVAENAFEEAARILDGVLTQTPDDVELLSLRADVALRGGNRLAAMICVNRASRALSPSASGPPPLVLHEVRSRVIAAQTAETSTPATGSPPAWTWPPVSVLTLPEKEAAALQEKALPHRVASPTTTDRASAAIAPTPTVAPAPLPVASANPPVAVPRRAGVVSTGVVVPTAELVDAKIIADTAGQWAASATASSQYGTSRYSAVQATGAPNIALGLAGDNPDAWCPASRNDGTAWLELTFARPVHATEVRVRQSNVPGAIAKIEAIDETGATHVWWEGVDPFVAPRVREIAWFAVRGPKTGYLVAKVRITLDLARVAGWKQIDAVQVVGTP